MAAREIPGLSTVLDGIRGAMAPAAAWCERQGVDNIYHLKELGDESEIEDFIDCLWTHVRLYLHGQRPPAPTRIRRHGPEPILRRRDAVPRTVHARRFQRAPALREHQPQARRGGLGAGALERAARLRLLSLEY